MSEEAKFSEKESLQIIAGMINHARNYYYASGLGCLLWGFTNLLCFVLTYLGETVNGFNLPFNPFYLMAITLMVQLYYDKREEKSKAAKTYLDDVHKYVWTAFGICVLILTVIGAITKIGYIVLPLLLLFFGLPTFITGCINKFRPFIVGGIVCWLLSIIAFLYKTEETLLLVAAGAVFAWIIPGYILRARFIKNRKMEHGV